MDKKEKKLIKKLLEFFDGDGFKEFAKVTQEEVAKQKELERFRLIKEKEAFLSKKNKDENGLDKDNLSEWTYLKFLIEYHKLDEEDRAFHEKLERIKNI